jgi:hypothetical protein
VTDRGRAALEVLAVGTVAFDARVPGQAIALGGTADVVVTLSPGRFGALKRWARGERRTVLDLRNAGPYLVAGHLDRVVVVAEPREPALRMALFAGALGTSGMRLLDDLDLLGIRVGRARLCPDSPGWAELERDPDDPDDPDAAQDFRRLAEYVVDRVRRATGVKLLPGFEVYEPKSK